MSLFLIIGVFSLACVTTGQAITCHQCENEKDCKEKPTECHTEEERPYCVKVNGIDKNGAAIYMKDCSGLPGLGITFPAGSTNLHDKCKTTEKTDGISHTLCVCTKNLCNNANVKLISFSFIFVLVSMQLMRNSFM